MGDGGGGGRGAREGVVVGIGEFIWNWYISSGLYLLEEAWYSFSQKL